MTRSLRVVIKCDSCGEEIEDEWGENHKGSLLMDLNGGGMRQIDVCHNCLLTEPILALTETLYTEADVIKIDDPKAKKTWPCPVCGEVLATAQARGRHVSTAHQTSMAEIESRTSGA